MTRLRASMAERATRTIKRELDKRIDKEVKLWTTYLPDVLRKYNDTMVHGATGFTPKEARNEANSCEIKTKLAFEVAAASKSAIAAIEGAGGSVKLLAAESVTA